MAVAQTALDTKRYDRQIRLWGMETQLRMSTTRVLICGAGGLAAEVAKNLVLAGVGHVTLQDHARVTADDLSRGGQFLLGDAEVGASRAEASLPFLRGLNPTVTVDACTDDARAATAEHLAQFDLVIATELHFDDVLKLGALVRAARELHTETPAKRARVAAADEGGHVPARRRVHLFAAGAVGLYGWAALDLGEYVYSVTTKKKGADGEETSETSAASISYPTVEAAFAHVSAARQPADIATILTAHRAFHCAEDVRVSAQRTLERLGLPQDTLSAALLDELAPHAAPALAPVCAILGGLLGQEAIKVISGKDTPIDNIVLLDTVAPPPNSGARVIRLAPP
ncbi:hypothetical protein KFE25_009618 [Diacronema lutheri]|uniref:THIF-type NAD/FAD binding fold domain-containing protein n=1 Tax=Diacronema lutheri TaxID=2081491 RepID=A0A8J5XZ65_DIALT|nr:hypothetical protein KFE25_009618 [Diacronema lutheri]